MSSGVLRGIGLDFMRALVGVVVGVLVALIAPYALFFLPVLLIPIRWVEWSIVGSFLKRGPVKDLSLLDFMGLQDNSPVSWRFGGLLISFAIDFIGFAMGWLPTRVC